MTIFGTVTLSSPLIARGSLFQNELVQTVVAEIVANVVDLVCKGCISFDYSFERFSVVDPTSFRFVEALKILRT